MGVTASCYGMMTVRIDDIMATPGKNMMEISQQHLKVRQEVKAQAEIRLPKWKMPLSTPGNE